MTRIADRRLLRLAALAAVAVALTLAGCGRKGSLDPPPSAAVSQPPAPDENSLGQTSNPMTPGYRRAPQQPVVAAAPSTTAAAPPEKRSFFLDFLIK